MTTMAASGSSSNVYVNALAGNTKLVEEQLLVSFDVPVSNVEEWSAILDSEWTTISEIPVYRTYLSPYNPTSEMMKAYISIENASDLSFSFSYDSTGQSIINGDIYALSYHNEDLNQVPWEANTAGAAFFAGGPDDPAMLYMSINDAMQQPSVNELGAGTAKFKTMIHEALHSVGLMHAFGGEHGTLPILGIDSRFSVMAYSAQYGRLDYGNAVTPMAFDIAALEHLYGPAEDKNSGDTIYHLRDAGTFALDLDALDGNIDIGRAFY